MGDDFVDGGFGWPISNAELLLRLAHRSSNPMHIDARRQLREATARTLRVERERRANSFVAKELPPPLSPLTARIAAEIHAAMFGTDWPDEREVAAGVTVRKFTVTPPTDEPEGEP